MSHPLDQLTALALGPGVHGENLRLAWRDACADVDLAYRTWHGADAKERRLRSFAYRAALEREAAAAIALSGFTKRSVGEAEPGGDHDPANGRSVSPAPA